MKNFRTFDFWRSTLVFLKTWLIPKFSIAFPVLILTTIIFSIPVETKVSEKFTANLERIFQAATNYFLLFTLCCLIVSVALCFLVQEEAFFSKKKKRKAAFIGRILGSVLMFGFGLLWFPLVFSTVFVHSLNIHVGTFNTSSAFFFLGAYIFLAYIFFQVTASFPPVRPSRLIFYKLQSKKKLESTFIEKIEARAHSLIGGSRGIIFLSVIQCPTGNVIYLLAGQAATANHWKQSRFIDSMFTALRIEWGPQLTWEKGGVISASDFQSIVVNMRGQ
jgi:hypothetical protein